jgi:hypothetical protein
MRGLFEKTQGLIGREPAVTPKADPIVFDKDSGITKEDQKAIIQEIEKAALQNKITAGPQAFVLKAQKKGILLPLLVNLLAIFLLAAGGLLLYYFYQRGETTLKEESVAITTAEGRLIEELKKESEEALLAKSREIDQIQGQLAVIDKERDELARNMEAKVASREQELRRGMEAELDAEREKLRQKGISEADIDRRLALLEAEKTAQFQRQMDGFRRQAEQERAKSESNLKSLQQEYQATLEQANAERQKVLEDSRQRETELKSQLEARTRTLEAESREAHQELSRIAEQREKEELASGQLLGFYDQIKGNMKAGRLDQALQDVEGARQYLNDPAIVALPAVQQRREVEFFVLDSIGSLVKAEMKKEQTDTGSLIAAASLLSDLRNRVTEGDAALARGEAGEAQKKYDQALALIPEVNKTHKYLLEKEMAEAKPAEQEWQGRLRESLARAQSAFQAKDYAGTLDAYAKALAYLPEDPAMTGRIVEEVRQSGYELGAERRRRQDSSAAGAALADADRLRAQGRFAEAIASYADLLARYPDAAQARSAVQGIGGAAEALAKASEGDTSALRKQLAERDAEATALTASLALAKKEAEGSQKALQERAAILEEELKGKAALAESLQREKQLLADEVEALKQELASLKQSAASSAAAPPAAPPASEPAGPVTDGPVMDEATKQKLARLETIEANYDRILASYRQYAAEEESLLSAKGDAGLIEAKLHLNAFLASAEDAFPGLWNRIKRYDGAFEKAGRTSALEDVNDVLYELSLRPIPQERQQFLDGELARRQSDPLMAGLLKDLKGHQGPAAGAGALKKADSILNEATLRKRPEARELYVQTEMVRNRANPELFQFLEKLLDLVRP